MFQVHVHRTGPNATRSPSGQVWENGGGYPAFEVIWQGRKKAEAFAVANAQGIRAVVTRAYMAEALHDNGRIPGSRIRDL